MAPHLIGGGIVKKVALCGLIGEPGGWKISPAGISEESSFIGILPTLPTIHSYLNDHGGKANNCVTSGSVHLWFSHDLNGHHWSKYIGERLSLKARR